MQNNGFSINPHLRNGTFSGREAFPINSGFYGPSITHEMLEMCHASLTLFYFAHIIAFSVLRRPLKFYNLGGKLMVYPFYPHKKTKGDFKLLGTSGANNLSLTCKHFFSLYSV